MTKSALLHLIHPTHTLIFQLCLIYTYTQHISVAVTISRSPLTLHKYIFVYADESITKNAPLLYRQMLIM